MDCHTQSFVHASGQARLDGFVSMGMQQFIVQHQPGQNKCPQMTPCGTLFHIMLRNFRRYGPDPVLPTTTDQMEAKPVFLNGVTGNVEQDIRTGTCQICHTVHKYICVSYVAAKGIVPHNATIHLCHLS